MRNPAWGYEHDSRITRATCQRRPADRDVSAPLHSTCFAHDCFVQKIPFITITTRYSAPVHHRMVMAPTPAPGLKRFAKGNFMSGETLMGSAQTSIDASKSGL